MKISYEIQPHTSPSNPKPNPAASALNKPSRAPQCQKIGPGCLYTLIDRPNLQALESPLLLLLLLLLLLRCRRRRLQGYRKLFCTP